MRWYFCLNCSPLGELRVQFSDLSSRAALPLKDNLPARHEELPQILTTFWRLILRDLSLLTRIACVAAALAICSSSQSAKPQSLERLKTSLSGAPATEGGGDRKGASGAIVFAVPETANSSEPDESALLGMGGPDSESSPEPLLPGAPGAAIAGGNPQREAVPWAAEWHQVPFSRIGIGADVSPLGIGIKASAPLDQYIDLRALINFFGYTTGRLEVDEFNVNATIHLASAAAAVDVYPYNSMWRLSAGLMFFNGNRLSTTADIVGGTSFTVDGKTYYSGTANPVTGTGTVGLNTIKPEPMFSFGFGRFVPHSNRHWSFPSEFGVIYMGAPALTVTTAGTVCTDKAQTNCSDIGSAGNPVATAFNNDLQGQLAKWRNDLNRVQFYPIFSFSVVYSFNIR